MTTKPEIITSDTLSLAVRPRSLGSHTLRRLFKQRNALLGMGILVFLVLVALFAPWLAPYEPEKVLIGVENVEGREAPCIHLLGWPPDRPRHILGITRASPDET